MALAIPGYAFKNEVSSDLLFDRPGRLAYANAGPDTNGSQFFITEVATPHLNGGYTIFGQCDDATVALVKQIAAMARDPMNDRPFRPVKIVHIKIVYGATAAKGCNADAQDRRLHLQIDASRTLTAEPANHEISR